MAALAELKCHLKQKAVLLKRPEECKKAGSDASEAKGQPDDPEEGGGGARRGDEGLQLDHLLLLGTAPIKAIPILKVLSKTIKRVDLIEFRSSCSKSKWPSV